MPALVSALNSVDLPTFGRPTIPHLTLTSGLSARGRGLRPRMQFVHGSLRIPGLQARPDRQRSGDRLFDERLFVAARRLQDVVDHGALETDLVSRMTNAETQAP